MVDKLPEPVLLRVFSRLMLLDLSRVARVSKQWKRIAFDASLWRETDLRGKNLSVNTFSLFLDQISLLVKEMNLGGCSVPLEIVCEIFKKCTQLRFLSLQGCKIAGLTANTDLLALLGEGSLSLLQVLDLRFLSSDGSRAFGKYLPYLPNIQVLAVDNISSTAAFSATMLSSMSHLRILQCQNCSSFTDSDVRILEKTCPDLESLCLTGCISITGSSFPDLLSGCKMLKTLLMSCTRLRDEHLLRTEWGKSSLTELDISYCYGITTNALLKMLPVLSDIRYLQLSFCGWGRALNDKVLSEMSQKNYSKLEVLDIHSNFNLNGRTLHNFLINCKVIVTFSVGNVINTFDDLNAILSCLPNLKHFYITKQSTIRTEAVFNCVMKYCPLIEVLALYNFYAINRNEVEKALIEMVKTCKQLRILCIRGTNVPLRTELTTLAGKIKFIANRHKLRIVRTPHFLPSGALLRIDNVGINTKLQQIELNE